MSFDLTHFRLKEVTECGIALRQMGTSAGSMEGAAQGVVRYLYENLLDPKTGNKVCALIRCFKTHPFQELTPELQGFARSMLGQGQEFPEMKCLTLLATAGLRPEWCSRKESTGHKAIPLPSEEAIHKLPMITNLVNQFGLETAMVVKPDPSLIIDLEEKTFNVFHVVDARGSPLIPSQKDFVVPIGIRSALGYGGMLPSGDLFAIIMFSLVPIPPETAQLFRTLALSTKLALVPFNDGPIFAG